MATRGDFWTFAADSGREIMRQGCLFGQQNQAVSTNNLPICRTSRSLFGASRLAAV